jgi:Protein of unknown function (DUF3830)
MPRFITITLEKRDVSCVARLLDEEAPRTCAALWEALPLGGDAYHAKYARNEVYTLVPRFAGEEPGIENPTVTPIPGDVMYFSFEPWQLTPGSHGYGEADTTHEHGQVVDLAIFYGRNNLLLNGDVGWVVGNVFATIVEGLDAMAAACNDVWRAGAIGERLAYARHLG